MPGKLITIEGGEGAGKSTVIRSMAALLEGAQVPHILTREPGGTALGERIRAALLDPNIGSINAEAELLGMFAARAQHLHEIIRPALAAGRWVVCDRFIDSSYAYQGGGRGLGNPRIKALEDWLGCPQPDLTFFLDLPVEVGLGRVRQRNQETDRIERERLSFFVDVRLAFLNRALAEPERIKVIDAGGTPGEVAGTVGAHLLRLLQSA